MTKLEDLRREADLRRNAFFQQVADMPKLLRPGQIVNDAIAGFDPDLKILKNVRLRTSQNPFAVLAALAGLFLLARQLSSMPYDNAPATRKRVRRSRLSHGTTKGDDHGHHIS